MGGDWIKLHRKIKDSSVFANPELLKLWILCLCKANWKDSWASVDGVTSPILVKRGQFITGRYELHREYYPKKKPDNKSPRTIWRWLQILETLENLTIKTSNRYSMITICNYNTYQNVDLENVQPNDQQLTNSCPTADQQLTTSEEDLRRSKKREEERSRFVSVWNDGRTRTIRKLTSDRTARLDERLADEGWLDAATSAIRQLPLPGDGWQPDFDWMISSEANVYRILEGAFEWRCQPGGNGDISKVGKGLFDET